MGQHDTQSTEVIRFSTNGELHARRRPVLVIFDQAKLSTWHLLVSKTTRIGREGDVKVLIPDDTVSRLHASIEFENIDRPDEVPRCQLIDHESRNGTYLNGTRITDPQGLQNGDRIFFGNTCVIFQVRSEQEINADQKLRALATIDALTGMLNRGYMAIQFQREFDRANRYGRPMTILLLDLDDFKKVNDSHGHPAGDLVLEQAAQQVLAKVRIHDLTGRYGGEEFAVLLPETGLQGAIVMAERVRRAISHFEFVTPNARLRMSVSVGVAEHLLDEPDTLEEMIARADEALLRAKKEGKDCVRVWGREEQ